jgi:hypothetical protein
VSAVAFNQNGIQVDKLIPRGREDFCDKHQAESASF